MGVFSLSAGAARAQTPASPPAPDSDPSGAPSVTPAPLPAPPLPILTPVPPNSGAAGALSSESRATAPGDAVPTPIPPPVTPLDPMSAPVSGFHNGLFYLRDHKDVFRLYVMGRVHVDGVSFYGPGISQLGPDSALKTTLQLRRARPELAGEFFNDWQWSLSVDLAPTSNDNPAAKTASRSCSVNPTTSAETCTDVTNPVEAPLQRPAATDAFINYGPTPWTNIQVGQFLIPFTMENRVSDNTTPFLERTMVSRSLGTPFTRDIGAMFWGQEPAGRLYYTIGIYNGDGANRTNADNRFDVVGRVFARPFAPDKKSLFQYAQIGVSGRFGSRDPKLVGYDVPSLTTEGGYVFWRGTYKDSQGRTVHIIPSGDQGAFGADLVVPVGSRFDLSGEMVYATSHTREALDGYQLSPFTERTTSLKGYAAYGIASAWLLGTRDIIGAASYGKPLHVDLTEPAKPATRGLQALAKVERLHLTYAGARSGELDAKTPIGEIDVWSLAFGLNYWATRHLRVGVNYTYYDFPSSAPLTASGPGTSVQTGKQRAVAPAQALATTAGDNEARSNGHTLHEVQLRAGVQF